MIQEGRQFGFTLESCNAISILRELFGQNLDGHAAAELSVLGFVYFSIIRAAFLGSPQTAPL